VSVTDARADTGTLTERTRSLALGAAVVGAHFLGDAAAFVLGEEAVLLVTPNGEERRVGLHAGAILAAACDGERIVTGGDDGKVVATDAAGTGTTIAVDPKRRWIDQVAVARGAIAWAAGKHVFVETGKGDERAIDLPSSAGGLAFAPKGFRLAIAHYNGATLWFPNAAAAPERLEWKGSHLAVVFSPDGKFLVTAMQEPTLHGWRLADGRHMRMSGYAGKVRSMAFTADGDWLATGGANQLILWPFAGKDGPLGKEPRMLAPAQALLTTVACHPTQPVVAAGYADGLALLVRLDDGAEIVARRPGAAPVTALAWNAAGNLLAFGTEDGEAGIVNLG
jgi:WD40 repeat protein